jgi:hypothetical protein
MALSMVGNLKKKEIKLKEVKTRPKKKRSPL